MAYLKTTPCIASSFFPAVLSFPFIVLALGLSSKESIAFKLYLYLHFPGNLG
jgi:hypothetical protein